MSSCGRWLRVPAIFAAVAILSCTVVMPASAKQSRELPPGPAHFSGQVLGVIGPSNRPTAFVMQVGNREIAFRIAPHAIFSALSAEAEVEGFVTNDYALVMCKRARRAWVANHIYFDVVGPIVSIHQVTVSGKILKLRPNGHRFQMQLDGGGSRWVNINKKTRFRIDGQFVTNPVSLSRGNSVQVAMRKAGNNWLALWINLRTTLRR